MNLGDDERLIEALRRRLDASVRELGPVQARRLAQARARALAAAEAPGRRRWAAGGLVTAAAALMLAVGLWWYSAPPAPQPPAVFEALAVAEHAELYEHLDFYLWLARQDVGG